MTIRLPQAERRWKAGFAAVLRSLLRTRSASPPHPNQVRRVLIIRQHNQLGDMLCVVPLLRAVRQFAPSAHVTLLASPENASPMQHHRYLDDLILFDKRQFLTRWGIRPVRLVRFLENLHKRNFDVVIIPATVSMSFTSDFLGWVTGAPWRVGARSLEGRANPAGVFHTLVRDLDWRGKESHQVMRNWEVAADFLPVPHELAHEITLTKLEVAEGKSLIDSYLQNSPGAVVLHPGAGKPANRWPVDRFARLAEYFLRETPLCVLVTAGPMDSAEHSYLEKALGNRVKFIVNEPVRRVASILLHCKLIVSNDTGIMHLGAAVGTPLLSLFGPTDPKQWAPLGPKNRYLLAEGGNLENLGFEEVRQVAGSMLQRHIGSSSTNAR